MQGAILIRHLLRQVPLAERGALALEIIDSAEPLPFAFESYTWMRVLRGDGQEDRILPAEFEATLGQDLAARIRNAASHSPLYVEFGADAPTLLWAWKESGPPGEMESVLREQLLASPDQIDKFLATYVGRSWGLESGVSRRSDFGRNAYDQITAVIDPVFVVERLRARHGDAINRETQDDESHSQEDWEREAARRFIEIHAYVVDQKKNQTVEAQQDVPNSGTAIGEE
jgi:hypothetical protein